MSQDRISLSGSAWRGGVVAVALGMVGCQSAVSPPDRPEPVVVPDGGAVPPVDGRRAMDAVAVVSPDATAATQRDGGGPDASRGDAAVNDTSTSGPPDSAPLGDVGAMPQDPCAYPFRRRVEVTNLAELERAFLEAEPGDLIRLADGRYEKKNFRLAKSGSPDAPLVVCGSRQAVLVTRDGYAFHLTGSHVILSGFHITGASKGLILDGANDNLLSDLEVSMTQEEGIHLRIHSSRNVLRGSYIHDTGLGEASYGEGIYIGLAENNWELTGGQPDRSDHNHIIGNRVERTAAECIDVKEGTRGGLIADNHFDGDGIKGDNAADSWMDMKGNGWVIERNVGKTTNNPNFKNGYEIHGKPNKVPNPEFGSDNVFRLNVAEMPSGIGYYVDPRTRGNVIHCDNKVNGAASTLTNVDCAK